ncbi:MAG: hypothetical protein R3D33_11300 [Hyphomicrobiaceae bacterium]
MSNGKSDDQKGAGRPGSDQGKSKRPTATLDLEAKVIETRDVPGAGSTSAGRDPAKEAAAAAGKEAAGPGDTSGKADPAKSGTAGPGSKAETSKSAAAGADAGKSADKGTTRSPEAAAAGATTSATTSASAAAVPPQRRSGGIGSFLSHMLAGIVGAVIALFGADQAARTIGIDLPWPGTDKRVEELQHRLGVVEADLKEQASDLSESTVNARFDQVFKRLADLDGLPARIGALETAQKSLVEKAAALDSGTGASAELPAGLESRIASLEQTLKTISDAAGSDGSGGGRVAQIASLAGRIGDLETEIDSRIGALKSQIARDLQVQSEEVTKRLAEGQTTTAGTAVALATLKESDSRVSRELETLKLDADRLGQRLDAVRASGEETRTAVETLRTEADRIGQTIANLKSDIEARVGALASSADVDQTLKPVAERLTGVEDTLQSVVSREKAREAAGNRILLTLALGDLKRAVDRGTGYRRELRAVQQLSGSTGDLATLEATADAGLPTIAMLQDELQGLAGRMIESGEPGDGKGSFIDDILASARSVVRVRRTGQVEGSGADAVVARMEDDLGRGDLAGVLDEAKGLPDSARTIAAPWLAKVEARIAVEKEIGEIEDGLRAAMGSGAGN